MHKVAKRQLGAAIAEDSKDGVTDHMISEAIPDAVEIGALPDEDAMEAKHLVVERMARSNPMKASLAFLQSADDDAEPSEGARINRRKHKQERSWLWRMLLKRMPVFTWLPEMRFASLRADLIAGITVGVMVIPQSMSYANIAGLQYIYGMYSACVPTFVYGFFGQSRHLAVGPVALVSLLVEAGLRDKLKEADCPGWSPGSGQAQYEVCTTEYAQLAMLCAAVIGIFQVVASVCRLGFIVNFLGHPVTSGFTSGAAIIIGLSQVKYIVGYNIEKSQFVHTTVMNLVDNADQLSPATLVLGLTWLCFLVCSKAISRKYRKKFGLLGPLAPLISCAVGTALLYLVEPLREEFNVKYVGDVPSGSIPVSFQYWKFEYLVAVLPTALTSCLIGYMESIAIGKNLAAKHGYSIEAGQELFALGLANLAGGALSCYPVTGSFSRSAVNNDTGAKSQLSGIITSVVMFLTLMYLTPLFYFLPKFALAAIVINSVLPLVAYSEAVKLWKVKKNDCLLWIVAFLGTLFLGVLYGIALAVLLSLMIVISESVRPQISILWLIPEGSGSMYRPMKQDPNGLFVQNVLIARIGSSMYFANASFIKDVLLHYVSDLEHINQTKYLVLEMTPVVSLDSSALHVLHDVVSEFRTRGIHIAFAMTTTRVEKTMKKAGLWNFIGDKWFHPTVHAAVQHCLQHKQAVVRKEKGVTEPLSPTSKIIVKREGREGSGVTFSNDADPNCTTICVRFDSTQGKSMITSDITAIMARHKIFVMRAQIEDDQDTGAARQTYLVQSTETKAKLKNSEVEVLQTDLRNVILSREEFRKNSAVAMPVNSLPSHARDGHMKDLEVALEQELGRKRYLEDVLRKNHDLVDTLLRGDGGAQTPPTKAPSSQPSQVCAPAYQEGDLGVAPLASEAEEVKVRLLDPPLKAPPPPSPILPQDQGGLDATISSWAHGLDDADTMLAEMRRRLRASATCLAGAMSRSTALASASHGHHLPVAIKDVDDLEGNTPAMAADSATVSPPREGEYMATDTEVGYEEEAEDEGEEEDDFEEDEDCSVAEENEHAAWP